MSKRYEGGVCGAGYIGHQSCRLPKGHAGDHDWAKGGTDISRLGDLGASRPVHTTEELAAAQQQAAAAERARIVGIIEAARDRYDKDVDIEWEEYQRALDLIEAAPTSAGGAE